MRKKISRGKLVLTTVFLVWLYGFVWDIFHPVPKMNFFDLNHIQVYNLISESRQFNISSAKKRMMAVRFEVERAREAKETCGGLCEVEKTAAFDFNGSIVQLATPLICGHLFAQKVHYERAHPFLERPLAEVPVELYNTFTYQRRAQFVKLYTNR